MKRLILCGFLGILACGAYLIGAAPPSPRDMRGSADKAFAAGNFKDAFINYEKLATDPNDEPGKVSHDLTQGILSLQRLGRSDEVDDFREKTIAVHGKNWRLLQTAAESLLAGETHGFIVAGKFYRGNHRGNDGKQVFTVERDRVRSLQLMQQGIDAVADEPNKDERGSFYFALADILMNTRFGGGAWQLQTLTDLSKLPDYEDSYPAYMYGNGNTRGAPVNADGTPVYHKLPKSWKEAATDGERWRWCLMQASEMSPEYASRATYTFAEFLRGQFDVQSMAQFGYSFGRHAGGGPESDDDTKKDESGPFAVSTLSEDETIARLASGIKRYKLPFEFNFIRLFQTLADTGKGQYQELALNMLGQIFEDRQQYDRSAEYWKKSIAQFGPGQNNYKQLRVDQILGNWANFDPLQTQPAGKEAAAWLLFRNGKHISYEAFEVDVPKLLSDVKAYIKSKPGQLDGEKVNVDGIGYRLVEKNEQQYIKGKAAQWEADVQPREKHFDKRVKVVVPVKKPGAYLVTAKMEGGNTTRIILWTADTVIVKKALDKGSYYFLADAVTGQPIAKAKVDFFGFQQQWTGDRNFKIDVKEFAQRTDGDGQIILDPGQQASGFQWLITATTDDGRFAYQGYTGIWSGRYYDPDYSQQKVFVITDRPVYRPGQSVKFKFWVGEAKYDQEGASPFANATFNVEIHNPKGEKILEKPFSADGSGGFDGELPLPKDATLGVYQCVIPNMGGGAFRVEEYKKPEFEVTVDAPTEPIMLGEKISATIKAKYYFGAPVTSAKVKYKVMRTSHSADWYPGGRWDWFYEPGYWWFSPDYNWYPGWRDWGCARPAPWWFPRQWERPEIVAENEVAIGADGTVKVEIDTAVAKAVHPDTDHKYEITAEVTDQSRRTIVGEGNVLVARKPFKVYAWVDRGHYQTGDAIEASFKAQTLDNKPIKGKGTLKLLKVEYKEQKPIESEVQKWDLGTDDQGAARMQMKADKPGQYRLSYAVTDSKAHTIEGGYVFVVRGEGFDGKQFRFNDIELLTDKKEYQAGDTVKLMVNTDRADGTVVLFLRPTNGIYLPPKVIRLKGKSTVEEVAVVKKDMPNFFIEAFTVSDGKLREEMREVVVPPESRVVNVEVLPSAQQYKPGQKATVKFKLTDGAGKPVAGSAVVSVYDKSVEYVSGGSNVPEIKSFFWKWRRHHNPRTESSLYRGSGPIARSGETTMGYLGVFGGMVADLESGAEGMTVLSTAAMDGRPGAFGGGLGGPGRPRGMVYAKGMAMDAAAAAPSAAAPMASNGALGEEELGRRADRQQGAQDKSGTALQPSQALVEPTVRKNFADTALWVASLTAGADGTGQVELTMPENLTTWKAKVWTMSAGTRVGEGSADVVTAKDLIVRLQAPRFFVQKDEVVLSANVHNYLKNAKSVKVTLDLGGDVLASLDAPNPAGPLTQIAEVPAGGEKRIDWRVHVLRPGEAKVRVSALTDEESDAMEMSFPAYVHGMLKTESFSGAMRPDDKGASLSFNIPNERLPEQSRVEIRYSPSVASAMVDSLPYLVDYPYGCTEQTLNRFVPTVITQKVLISMGLDLKDIEKKRTNLNAQEIGDDKVRAADWKRNNPPNPGVHERNPVFDMETVAAMTKDGVMHLTNMQLTDGGWGWFSGSGEQSWPHTTAVVVHGLQIAKENDVAIGPGVIERGVEWLKRYQARQIMLIKNAPGRVQPWKDHADDMDAFVYMVLTDARAQGNDMKEMDDFLYRDRNFIGVYSKAMYGLALFQQNEKQKLDMILQNISQYLVQDDENQTAYLKMPEGNAWWNWYGSDTEAMAYYLKLLSRTDPKGANASRLAKYLINNRKHASYWNSTRDTALCVEAFADFIKASGESKPDMTLAIAIDGRKMKEVKITADNFFSFDNKVVVSGADVTPGQHKIEFTKAGTGALYFNAYVTNFTLEDPIKKAGLEVKVQRQFYKLVEVDKKIKVSGSLGQALDQKVEKYERQPLSDGAVLKSGDLVEVELEIDSKNDYEYLLFEDMKASGFEPVELRSGYNNNDLHAYMELHDERVCFFARALARGKHSVSYRLRAEIPGKFSALPTKAGAMYAPELKANSDENKLRITD
jgi:alpha-2-macroglobulin